MAKCKPKSKHKSKRYTKTDLARAYQRKSKKKQHHETLLTGLLSPIQVLEKLRADRELVWKSKTIKETLSILKNIQPFWDNYQEDYPKLAKMLLDTVRRILSCQGYTKSTPTDWIEAGVFINRHLKIKPQEKAGQGQTNIPDYRALDLAKRTVTIGTTTYPITSEKVWEFLKNLCSALRDDRIVPRYEGTNDNKNNVDQLRRKIGKDNLKKLIIFGSSHYKLNPEVNMLNSGQAGIRKTHVSRNRK